MSAPPVVVSEPDLFDLVLRHDELSLGAKAIIVYVLVQPRRRVITRAELERLGGDAVRGQLDGLLHELVAAHWLMGPLAHAGTGRGAPLLRRWLPAEGGR
jgi:hypothetical protein